MPVYNHCSSSSGAAETTTTTITHTQKFLTHVTIFVSVTIAHVFLLLLLLLLSLVGTQYFITDAVCDGLLLCAISPCVCLLQEYYSMAYFITLQKSVFIFIYTFPTIFIIDIYISACRDASYCRVQYRGSIERKLMESKIYFCCQ